MGKTMLQEFSKILKTFNELLEVSTALLEWIDAVPDETVLPTMPGADRDWVDSVFYRSKLIADSKPNEADQCKSATEAN